MQTLPEYILAEFGNNAEYVAQLYTEWRHSPSSVPQAWHDYFAGILAREERTIDVTITNGAPKPEALPAPVREIVREVVHDGFEPPKTGIVSPSALIDPKLASYEEAQPIRGVAGMIVDNMQSSLGLPVATSQRMIPVKVMEENRLIINQTLANQGRKVSFTHLIAWALVEGLGHFPQMNAAYGFINGKPHRIQRHDVNFGVAIDLERKDGSRSLVVPNIKAANRMDFNQFLTAYDDIITRARNGKLTTDDYQGTSLTLTNPGTIGTIMSVPRLMEGQGVIIATGAIGYPPEYSATADETITELGISKVMAMTSTYDHRIIQGAESGMFLAKVHELLLGKENFYERIFAALLIPYPTVKWQRDNLPLGTAQTLERQMEKQASVLTLIRATRVRGHLLADLNPLTKEVKEYHPDLDPATYGLTLWDLDRSFLTTGGGNGTGALAGQKRLTLRQVLDILRRSYSGHIGIEFMNIPNPEEREWLQGQFESATPPAPPTKERRLHILQDMSEAEAFEQFLHKRYVGSKRFSLEGSETVIPMLSAILDRAADQEVEEAVLGMAHRGRLNVLKNILNKSARNIFGEFEGVTENVDVMGTGDVKYHLGATGKRTTPAGHTIEMTLASNPSHLEAVDPVVEGIAHAKQRRRKGMQDGVAMDKVLPILIHGDAAFAGQGLVAETLNLSQLRGYRTGGTIHIIINNQIGFTTDPMDSRSTPFATDIAKMGQIPILHVNGDDPEAAVRAAEIALDYRQKFQKDVVIDLVCYRRWGHNEGDDPSFTQPTMYRIIENRASPREVYAAALVRGKVLAQEQVQAYYDSAVAALEEGTTGLKEFKEPQPPVYKDYYDLSRVNPPVTKADRDTLIAISKILGNPPPEFAAHPKLLRQLQRRELKGDGSDRIDWGSAEALAFGTLLLDGHPVRLSGQDSGRGTFSHRHAVLHNYETGEDYIPLNHLNPNQAPFRVYDSMLSEAAVLGFEFGYTLGEPEALVMWEAQFGDFANGAQVIIDQFISSSQSKWGTASDLVMLLPHGFEGQGPEHSSARLERYLQLCAEGNMAVTYPTTAGNYFHLLRRQKKDNKQRPLIVMTPKSLLRLPAASSPLEALTDGNFQHVIDDASIHNSERVTRIVFMSGKLYYDMATAKKDDSIALVRVEQLYPYPRPAIQAVLERYPNAREFIWAQEEPRNQGAWTFIQPFLYQDLPAGTRLYYVGRSPAAAPATGSNKIHQQQQAGIVAQALGTWTS
jgi:multifunctional 2-oxoglutarate metabolism enzyme